MATIINYGLHPEVFFPPSMFTNLVLTLLHVFWITQLFLIKDFITLSISKYAASNKCAITNKSPAKSIMQSSILYPIYKFSAQSFCVPLKSFLHYPHNCLSNWTCFNKNTQQQYTTKVQQKKEILERNNKQFDQFISSIRSQHLVKFIN